MSDAAERLKWWAEEHESHGDRVCEVTVADLWEVLSERDEARAMLNEFRLIYAKAVGRDDVAVVEAWGHLENVIFNARTDARTEAILRERVEAERDELSAKLVEMQEYAVELQEERDAARAQVAALQDALDSIAWLAEDTAKKNLFYVQENRSAAELARGRAYQDMARRIRYALAGTEDET